MTDKKILLLALLFLAGCASDPMEESGGKEAPAAAMRKIVNAPANAARGELLIYFDGDAVGDVEQTAAAAAITRTAATRSGIAPVDDIFTQLGVTSLRRVFPCNPVAEERTRAAGLHKWYIVTFGEEVDLDAAARRLAAVSEVSFVQFNTKLQLASDNRACPYRAVRRRRAPPPEVSTIPATRTSGTTATTATEYLPKRRAPERISTWRRRGNSPRAIRR